jgi:hypothetical protein
MIKWKAEAPGIGSQEATAAKLIGRGELGESAVTITQTGSKITCLLDGKACLEFIDTDGEVSDIKLLQPGAMDLAEFFIDLIN